MIYLVALLGGLPLYHLFRFFPVCALLLFAVLGAVLAFQKKFIPLALIVAGILYAYARYGPPPLDPGFQGVHWVQGYFTAPARELDGGYAQEFEAQDRSYAGALDILTGTAFEVGARYRLKLKLYGPGGKVNPGGWFGDPFAVLMDAEGPFAEERTPRVLVNRARDALGDEIARRMGPDEAALTTAVTTGERGGLSHELREAFRASGVAHLLSISGTHFGLIGILLFGIVRTALLRLPHRWLERLTEAVTPTEAAVLVTFPFMLFYLGLSGARVPSVRSFVMMSLFMLGLLLGRRGRWLNFVLAAAVLLAYWDPQVLFGLSFQLSFLAVLFIGISVKGRGHWSLEHPEEGAMPLDDEQDGDARPPLWMRLSRGLWLYVKVSVLISLAASLGVAPLVAYHFHYGSVMSPVVNLLVTPLVCMVLVPLSLMSSLCFLVFGAYPLAPVIELVAKASLGLVGLFSALPFSAVSIKPMPPAVPLLFYLGCLVWFVYKKRTLIVLPLLPLVIWGLVSAAAEQPLRVTFLDAGRADAAVAELPDGKTLIFDTGWRGTKVDYYLRYRGIRNIDAVILSHGFADHAGGLGRLADRYKIAEVWDAGNISYDESLQRLKRRTLTRGMHTGGEGWRADILHPYAGFSPGTETERQAVDNTSLVVRLAGENSSVLFTGDIEDEAVQDLLHLGDTLKSTVLKAPHHAMDPGALKVLLPVVGSDVVVVTAGKVPKRSEDVFNGHAVWVTGRDGAVKAEERDGQLVMSSFADFRLQEALEPGREWKNIKRVFSVW